MKFMIRSKVQYLGITLLALILCSSKAVAADDIQFKADAPSTVAMGSQFEVTFTVNSASISDFRAPSFDNFDVRFGPTRSTQSYTSIVNGNTSSVNNVTFTYIVMPVKEGTFTLGAASVSVKGKTYKSNNLKIKVLPEDKSASSQSSRGRGGNRSSEVSDKDLFIRTVLSKSSVYEQEAVVLTEKLYVASVSLSGLRPTKVADHKGFHSQSLRVGNDIKWDLENYNGRNYRTGVLNEYVLFPQKSGKLSIDPVTYEAEVELPSDFDDPFDVFFNRSARSSSFRKAISSKPITIDVLPLPSGKPANYTGGVGSFKLDTSVSANKVKANEAITIRLVISGTGNLKLVKTPVVEFPSDFEVYEPKVEDNLKLSTKGDTGNLVIEYLVIPRHEGNYKLDPITFSYFDASSKRYKTLSSGPIAITVEKSADGATSTTNGAVVSNFTNKEQLKIQNEDIRFIKLNDVKLKKQTTFMQGSLGYRLFFIIAIILFIAFIAFNMSQTKLNSNVALVRNKKANKMARNRMKKAYKLSVADNRDEFYDEVLRALWGYISDKLTIPVSKLTKDNVDQELLSHNVNDELRKDFIDLLNDCEFAKFAPGNSDLAMDKILARSTELIGNLEGVIKK